jgi:hypothetical protein
MPMPTTLSNRFLPATTGALLLTTAAAVGVVGCTTVTENASFIQTKVASTVGKPFTETDHSRSTGAKTSVIRDDETTQEHEYRWSNGCSYALAVDKATGIIRSWRYTSSPEPCRKVSLYSFGT